MAVEGLLWENDWHSACKALFEAARLFYAWRTKTPKSRDGHISIRSVYTLPKVKTTFGADVSAHLTIGGGGQRLGVGV